MVKLFGQNLVVLFRINLGKVVKFIKLINITGWYWVTQVFVFSLFSIVSLGVWWKWYHNPVSLDQPLLNERVAQYIGRVFTLSEPIVDGFGRVHVDDSFWKVKGEDCPARTRVQVTGADGMALVVKILRP